MEMRSTTTATAFFCCLFYLAAQFLGGAAVTITTGSDDGTELWGYVEVRAKAHMFWHFYKSPQQVSSPEKPWPTIMWMRVEPGEATSWFGNFNGIGPLDTNLKHRNSTWLHKANLLFVDHPVGAGYSYVDDESALASTLLQAGMDLVELFKVLAKEIPTLQSSPLYLVAKGNSALTSYSARMAAMISLTAGSLNLTLGGVVFRDGAISPDDFL